MRPQVVDRVLRLASDAGADCIVATGDLIDAHGARVAAVMERLADIRAPLGKFAITGNHEVYPGLAGSIGLLEQGGFRVLRQDAVPVGDHLWIAGVDDPAVRRDYRSLPGRSLEALYDDARTVPRMRILLKHQPSAAADLAGAFDLQLSGHIHGGQIFPFGLITWAAYGITTGAMHSSGNGPRIYVSPGCGTWGPPFRLFSPPELTLFVIRPEHRRD
jgi:predicted MPP superfamily phosphohydrolase